MFVYKFRQCSKILREFFCGSWKNHENPKNLNPEKISATRVSLDKFCSWNGLFCLPAVLINIAYSARNSARTPLFCSNFARYPKNFGPSGLTYFHKHGREPGPNPKYLIRFSLCEQNCNSSHFISLKLDETEFFLLASFKKVHQTNA